jgi:hypothetical protein
LPFILLLSEKIENEEIKIKPNSGWQNNSWLGKKLTPKIETVFFFIFGRLSRVRFFLFFRKTFMTIDCRFFGRISHQPVFSGLLRRIARTRCPIREKTFHRIHICPNHFCPNHLSPNPSLFKSFFVRTESFFFYGYQWYRC